MYSKYSKQYDIWSESYDPERNEMKILERYIDWTGKSVLEVGCGTGRFTHRICDKASAVVSVDNDPEAIEIASQKTALKDVTFLTLDASEIDVLDRQFDIIVYSWSLNYVHDALTSIKQAIELLKPKGEIVILYTWLGEYERLYRSVRPCNPLSLENYTIARNEMIFQQFTIIEDVIRCSFVYDNVEEAVSKNVFFYDAEGEGPLSEAERDIYEEKIIVHSDTNNRVSIEDEVKLLIGKRSGVSV